MEQHTTPPHVLPVANGCIGNANAVQLFKRFSTWLAPRLLAPNVKFCSWRDKAFVLLGAQSGAITPATLSLVFHL